MPSRRHAIVISILLCALWPAVALGAPPARISAAFSPERLGGATTVSVDFQIGTPGDAPTPLHSVELAYPSDLGFATSGLGLAACPPEALATLGPVVCPADSKMGGGSALVEIPVGPQLIRETVSLKVFAGPSPDGYLHLLIYAAGKYPLIAQVVLTGELLPGRIDVVVPPIPSLPGAPNVALAQMHLTIGGHLTYYEQLDGTRRAYHPPGVGLPRSCPRGGFRFAATFAFVEGRPATASTRIACPRALS